MMSLPALQAPAPRRLRAFHAQPPEEPPELVSVRLPPAFCACCAARLSKDTSRRAGLASSSSELPPAANPTTAAKASKDRSCTNSAYSPPSPAWPICKASGQGSLGPRQEESGLVLCKGHQRRQMTVHLPRRDSPPCQLSRSPWAIPPQRRCHTAVGWLAGGGSGLL